MMQDAVLAGHAKAMRRNPTEPEKRLWRHLSNSQLGGFKLRRQTVIAPDIVDFLCPSKALIVEVDGDTHDDPKKDARRERRLASRGYRIVRFTNSDVMGNIEGVLTVLLSALNEAPDRWPRPHPNPSPEGEGLDLGATVSPSSSEEGFGVVAAGHSAGL